MKYLKYSLILLAVVAVPAVYSQAQISLGVQVGPAYGPVYAYGPPPVCEYGFYPYYPYDCAPYGYWGPQWFVSGVFIGAGPWYHWYYTHPGFYRGYYYRGFRGDWDHDRGFRRGDWDHNRGFRGGDFRDRGFHGGDFHDRGFRGDHAFNRAPAFRGGNNFRGAPAFHGGGGGNFHGGGGFRAGGGGGFHGGGGHGSGHGGASHGR